MSCPFQKDSREIRLAIHDRLMRKISHQAALPEDAETIEYCDGEYHWKIYGFGPVVREDYWLREAITGKCFDVAKAEQEEYIGRHGDMERTFANYVVADENRDAYSKVKGWRKSEYKTLLIHGMTGRGKTHLAKAVQGEFLKDYARTAFITATALYEVFIKAQPAAREYDIEAMQQLAEIREADLFILDDLGNERQNAGLFFAEQLQKLLDEKRGRMIITSNFAEYELEKRYSAPIVSRIMEKLIAVSLRGKDYRRAK